MNIKILGTRGEIKPSAPYHARHSGVLIDDTILLDCGEESFLNYDPKAIVITHLHPDHAFFVRQATNALSIPIYAPEAYDNMPMHVITKPVAIEDFSIEPIPTVHSIKVKSNAYIITHNNKKILYTGDIISIEKKYRSRLQQCDAVITEASHIKKGGFVRQDEAHHIFGHTGVPNLVTFFKQFTKKIIFVHFGSWFYADMPHARKEFEKLAREHGIEIIVGYDGLELAV